MTLPPLSLRRSSPPWRVVTALLLGIASVLHGADGAASPPAPPVPAPIVSPAETYEVSDHPRDLLKVDDTMHRYFAERITAAPMTDKRLHQIIDAILRPEGLNFAYDSEAALDARGTFQLRRGNCVSFSFLVVAIAREFGFRATFQNVDTADHWDRFGTLVAAVNHTNVRVETDSAVYIVDLRLDLIPYLQADAMHEISDETAAAQLYSDIGFFRLVHGRTSEALRYMTLATTVDPRHPGAWANRANVHARLGDLAMARTCFERALRVQRGDMGALAGLVDILRRLGTPEDLKLADKLQRRAQSVRERNPYFHEFLAQQAEDRGDWAAADKSLARAISLKRDEPEFYARRVTALQHLGRNDEAQRVQKKLEAVREQLAAHSIHFWR